jgi:hypothetical protein
MATSVTMGLCRALALSGRVASSADASMPGLLVPARASAVGRARIAGRG